MSVVDNTFETKGTQLYFVSSNAAVKLTCPTGITGINGGSKAKIDTTCLDVVGAFRTYIGGFADAAQVVVPFILYKGDVSQQDLVTLQQSGATVSWMACLSDAVTAPTVDTDDSLITPTDRTTFAFRAYIDNLNFDAATNEVVRGTLTLQVTGSTTAHWAV